MEVRSAKISSKVSFNSLTTSIRETIFRYLDPQTLFELTLVSQTFKDEIETVATKAFTETLGIVTSLDNSRQRREIWEAIFRFRSKKTKSVFSLLHWSIGIIFAGIFHNLNSKTNRAKLCICNWTNIGSNFLPYTIHRSDEAISKQFPRNKFAALFTSARCGAWQVQNFHWVPYKPQASEHDL